MQGMQMQDIRLYLIYISQQTPGGQTVEPTVQTNQPTGQGGKVYLCRRVKSIYKFPICTCPPAIGYIGFLPTSAQLRVNTGYDPRCSPLIIMTVDL